MEKPLKPFVALDEGWRPKPIDVLSPVSCPGAPVHTGQCDRGRVMRVVGTMNYSYSTRQVSLGRSGDGRPPDPTRRAHILCSR